MNYPTNEELRHAARMARDGVWTHDHDCSTYVSDVNGFP